MNIQFKGHVKITVRNVDTNEIINIIENNNLIVTNGLNILADVLIGHSSISYCGVGSGTTEPALTDTNLEMAIGVRKPVTDTSRVGTIALFSTFFSSADNNGTWGEAILANSLSGDNTIISRALFENSFEKNNFKTCTVDWTITVSELGG